MRLVDVLIAAADEQQRSVPTLRSVANSQPAEAASTSGVDAALVVDTAHSSPQYSPRGAYTRSSQSQLRIIARRESSPNSASPTPSNRQKAAPPNATMAVVPVVEDVISTVDAETTAKVDKAFELTARANKLISQGLHNCSEWNEVRDLYFNAAAHFQGAGYHCEAGEAFNNAAAISRVYGSQLEVATAASYAVDSFKVADPMQAIALLKETLQIHRDDGRTNLEAKAAKDIAEMYENLGEKSEALNFYRHACALYERQEMTRNFYLKTLEKCARLSADLMAYRDAIASFEKLAQSATKGTRVTDRYTFALLCWLADASGERQAAIIAKANSTFDKYQDIDQYLQKGVEHDLIKGFLAAWDKGSLAMFDATHKRYVEYRGAEEWVERQIAQIRSNLFQYVLPYM